MIIAELEELARRHRRTELRCIWATDSAHGLLNAQPPGLIGRLLSEFAPIDGPFHVNVVQAVADQRVLAGETDVTPGSTSISRFSYRIVPVGSMVGISVVDRSPLREVGDRAEWLENLITGGATSSVVAAAILRPVMADGQAIDFEFEAINDLGGEMLGVRPPDIVGRRFSEWSELPAGEHPIAKAVLASWRSGELTTFETSGSGAKIKASWLRCQVTPLDSRVILHVVDISEQRASEAALAASEHLFRSVFETASEGIALIKRNGTFRYVNQAFADMFQTGRADLVGRSSVICMHPDEIEQNRELAREALRTSENTAPQRRFRLIRGDGTEFRASVNSAFTRDIDGAVDGFVLMVSDIEEQLRSAEALAASEARYRAIVEHADVLLMLSDARGQVVYVNDRMLTTLAMKRDQLVGQRSLSILGEAVSAQVAEDFRQLANGVDVLPVRYDLVALDGRNVLAIGSVVALRNPEGGFDGVVAVAADITHLAEQDYARREMEAALQTAEQRERERLASDLHDGPVQTLSALSLRLGGALRNDRIDPELVSSAEQLVGTTIRELRMLLFQMSPAELESETLASCLQDRAERILPEGVSVEVDDQRDLPIDQRTTEALFRICQEAVANVGKHADATAVKIALHDTANETILEVTDNGLGGSDDAFMSGAAGHIGLRTMYERARQLGGYCEVTSSPGFGTTVFVRLPIGGASSRVPTE